MSTIDSLDLKPDAPVEFRGEFRPIDTNVPGIRIGEHMPRTARQMDKIALIRSFHHRNSDHGPADHYILTGYFPQAGFNPTLTPNNQRPAHGAIIAHKLGPKGGVPPYVCLPRMHPSAGRLIWARTTRPSSSTRTPMLLTLPCPTLCRRRSLPPPAWSPGKHCCDN